MANIFDWWNLGKDSAANLKSLGGPENSAKFKNLISNDWAQRQIQNVGGSKFWNPVRSLGVWAADKGGMGSGPTPLVRQAAKRIGLPAAVGFGAYDLTNTVMDSNWADDIGLGRNDFKDYGKSLFNLVDSAKNKLGNFDYQQSVNNLRDGIFDTDTIAKIASQYPSDPQTNPIGTYGVGVQSDAKHQAASARASDMFYDLLKWNPIIPKAVRGPIADTLSFAGGVGVEGVGSLFDYAKSGFKDKNYLTAAKEDIVSDWKGTFGTDYGTSTADIMNNVYKENNYAPKINSNIFNQGQMEVDDKVPYLTRREILAKKKAEQLRLAKVAEQQRLDKITATEQARPTNNWINGVQTQASIDRGNRAVAAAGGSMDDFSDIPVPTPTPAYIPPVTPYSPPPRVHNPVVRGNPAPRGTGFEYKGGRPTGPMGYGL